MRQETRTIAVMVVSLLVAVEAAAQVPQLITYQGRLTETNGVPFTGTHTVVFRVYDAETGGTKLWEENHTVTLAKEDNGIFSVVLGSLNALSNLDFNQSLWLALAVDGEGEMAPRQRLTAVGYAINADTLDGVNSTQFVRTDATSTVSKELILKPSTPPVANTKLLEVQTSAGATQFSVDAEGDVAVAGNLTVTGAITGASLTSGTVTSVGAGAGLSGGPITTSGTLSLDVETTSTTSTTSANSGLEATTDGLRLVGGCSNGQVLKWNATSTVWECSADTDTSSGGTVTSVDSGAGLTGGPITASGTLAVGAGSGITVNADDIAVKLAGGPGLAADANGLSLLRSCSDGQLLKWTASSSSWGCAADTDTDTNSGGTITSITAGTGLSGGTIIGSGTIALSTPVSVANGGTGASTAGGARANLINCLPIGSSDNQDQKDDFKFLWPIPVAGTLSQVSVVVSRAPGSGKSWSVTASGGSANLSCTISGTATSCTATGTATFSAGNLLTVQFAKSGGGISSTQGAGWGACLIPD